jgi:glycyl-tRNA synthetase alpha chain
VAQAYFNARADLGFPLAKDALRQEALDRIQAEAK